MHGPQNPGSTDPERPFRIFTDIIDRIEQIRVYHGLNKSQFSRTINMSPQTYNNFVGSQNSKPNVELLHGVVSRFDANPMWILTGRGEMFTRRAGGRPGWALTAKSKPGIAVSSLQGDKMIPESTPELALVEPILKRLEERFEKIDREFRPVLDRLIHVLERYSRANPAGSAGEIREILEHIEQRLPPHSNQRYDE